jgi:hypothetical protein
MKVAELGLMAVAGWMAIGVAGTVVSLARGRREEAARHAAWIAVVAGAYLLVLLGVSATQRQRVVPMGRDQCFDDMCFAVEGVDEVPGLVAGDAGRVVRVTVRVANHGHHAEAEGLIEAYLVDSKGREWEALPGLSGNRLNARVAGGSQMVSQPMFRVAGDSRGLGLVLTHGKWQPGRLVVGDSDSFGHRRTVVPLGR